MSERLHSASRWPLALLFAAVPVTFLFLGPNRWSEVLEVGMVLSPWLLASLGMAFRVPAARGLAVGISALCFGGYLLGAGLSVPENGPQTLLLAQGLGLLLLLPGFSKVFEDNRRLRFTSFVLGLTIPLAAFHAVFQSGASQGLAWGAIALTALGVVGLAFQRTWALFVFLFAAAGLAVATVMVEPVMFSDIGPPDELGYLAAGALACTWLPWIAPVFRKLRGDGSSAA